MTLFVYVGGVDVSSAIMLDDGIAELTEAADGQQTESQITVDDPSLTRTFLELARVVVNETACTPPRCFTGIVTEAVQTRGRNPLGRAWKLTVTDLNELLHRRVLRGSGAKRPSETGTQRITWLLSTTGMSGIVFDNGQVMANAWAYDPADYRGRYADDVLASIISASAANRWTFFVYWDDTTGQPSLFYGDLTTTTFDSTMKITNVLANLGSLIVAPLEGNDLTGEGAGIYDGVYIDWVGGPTYLQRASTFATYGVHRDGILESTRINNSTTALRHANTFLDIHAGPVETIRCTVKLPRAQVNLIRAGHRIPVYVSDFEGFDDPGYTFARVTRRTFAFASMTDQLYDVSLELSTRGIAQTGGGDPGTFPTPPPGLPRIVQDKSSNAGSVLMDEMPALGHLMTCEIAHRGTGIGTLSGWTLLDTCDNGTWPGAVFWRIADGVTQSVGPPSGSAGYQMHVTEWDDGVILDPTYGVLNSQSGTAVSAGGPITPPAGSTVVGLGVYTTFFTYAWTPAAGVSTFYDGVYFSGGAPRMSVGYRTNVSGSTVIDGTLASADAWAGITYAVHADTTSNPPTSGQWIYDEIVTMTGATGTTAFGYAAGSLLVKVDGVTISKASFTETDPATGTFTLSWTPDTDEVVTVTYQGISG